MKMNEIRDYIIDIIDIKELNLNPEKIYHKWVDYKTIELKNANFSKIEKLPLVKHYDIIDNIMFPYYKAGKYKIVKTRELWHNSGMAIYWVYDRWNKKLWQIKQFYQEDKSHKNVLELRGLFCHFHEQDTQDILEVVGLENQYSKQILHIDYCIDVLDYSVEEVVEAIKSEKEYKIKLIKEKWKIEYYCIKTSKTEIKIYNKIQDILDNHKNEQRYKDYILLNRAVTRIEVAFKDTNNWGNRTYWAILKKIEWLFCDMLNKTLAINSGLWASFKKWINVIKEVIEKWVEKVREVREVLDYNVKTLKRAITNLQFLLSEKEQKTYIEKELKSCERSSLHYNLNNLVNIIS